MKQKTKVSLIKKSRLYYILLNIFKFEKFKLNRSLVGKCKFTKMKSKILNTH